MINNIKPALVISLIYYLAYFIGMMDTKYLINNIFSTVCMFFTIVIGLALARSINGYEPLPVKESFVKKKDRTHQVLFMLLSALIIVILYIIVSIISSGILPKIFHEVNKSAQAIDTLPQKNKFLAFFLLLSGAGIAEEAMYRLLFLSLFWKLIKKPWLAIILSSLCFGLYHLTPLDYMYKVFWQFPLTQVTSVFLAGLIFGYAYKKRGFETSVLGHTLCDFVGVLCMR